MTEKHAIFETWAPAESPWSLWAKPMVFAHISDIDVGTAVQSDTFEVTCPPASERCALVVDLPGGSAVAAGIALARRGYRPVPLFNSCPPDETERSRMIAAAVDTTAILDALVSNAAELARCSLSADAPPAFLLDALRGAPGMYIGEQVFDNRSAVFPADFPTTTFLRARQISCVRVLRVPAIPIGTDLRYALRPWIEAGIAIDAAGPEGEPFAIQWPRSGILGELIERLRLGWSLRRNRAGGYGRLVPESSGG